MNEKDNISAVASAMLCNTCGACSGICPAEAIRYSETTGGYYLPVVDNDACTLCGLCREVCPGIHFGKTLLANMPGDPFAGSAIEAFIGKASEKEIFDKSQSGGIVSALLAHALETGQITGAVTVAMCPGSPPRPLAKIARTRYEILQAQKSKYCPVPVLGVLRDLQDHTGRLAVVGTSCQIHGLLNVLDKLPGFRHKIAFTVGLVCDRVLTFSALDYLFLMASIKHNEAPVNIHFRDKSVCGYPGDVHVFFDHSKSVVLPSKTRIQIKDYYTPARCRLCFDKMNVYSDITVGDPHGLKNVDRKNGESMLVSRTGKGQNVVNYAVQSGAINIRTVQYEQVLKGQKIDKKREQWRGYIEAWKKMGNALPDYYEQVKKHAPLTVDLQKLQQDLKYSLELDRVSSRQELIRKVKNKLREKELINGLLYPLRLPRRAVRKVIKMILRCRVQSDS